MLTVKEITDAQKWNAFVCNPAFSMPAFFQTWQWGDVQKGLGFSVLRLGLFQQKKLVGVCQIVDVRARRGHYMHLRHGPVLSPFDRKNFEFFIAYIKKLALEKGASFIRMSPLVEEGLVDMQMLKKMGFRNAPIHRMDAEVCWVLDITKPENILLANMRKAHRYLIKKGLQDSGLQIIQTKNPKDIEKFLPLYKSLSQRRHFVPHRGVAEEFSVFSKADEEVLFLAIYNQQVIAGALIAFVGSMAIYRHSASDDAFRNIPAMHVIQWQAILEAKKRGIKLYNFWGIAPDVSQKHPWSGLTLFKTGFGGQKKEFLRAQDLPLRKSYLRTYAIESFVKWKKGY